jgi:hydrogenase maturation factor
MTAPTTVPAVDSSGLGEDLSADLATASLALARRFAAGGTLWCLAPAGEPHAQHIAAEFVHPVIAGKKALPAVALTGPGLVSTVRVSAQPGDLVIAVAAADNPAVRSVMRRAPAWGVTTLWIGSGARPTAGAADHVLWLGGPDPRTPATDGFAQLCHLLWELTHACFEHPELLTQAAEQCTDEVCITCGDEGRLGEVIALEHDSQALVRTATGAESISTMLVDPVETDDLLLIHAGMAISKLDGEAAAYEHLAEQGEQR